MHLELTEILVCPDCGPGHGLIAFVDRMEERRIVEGRLDCSMCERRHRIEDGIVRLAPDSRSGSSGARSEVRGEPPRDPECEPELPGDAAAAAAALLGPPDGSQRLLLALGGTRILAPDLADLRPEAAIVTYGAARAAASTDVGSEARVYPLVVTGDVASPGLPFRSGVLDGALLSGGSTPLLEEVVRALSAGARLVVLSPTSAATAALAELEGVEELAADPRAWVGSRL